LGWLWTRILLISAYWELGLQAWATSFWLHFCFWARGLSWGCGSSDRTPASQVQSPEIKPQYWRERKRGILLKFPRLVLNSWAQVILLPQPHEYHQIILWLLSI
jgi:hypothetical protein